MPSTQEDVKTPLSEESIVQIKTARYEFLKFFLGTFVIGIAGIISTAIFKNYELKISSRQTENEYLNSYITQYSNLYKSDSLGKYDKIAEMFEVLSIATTDEDMQKRWDSLRRYFEGKIQTINDSIGKYKDSVSVASIKVDSFKLVQKDLEVKITSLEKTSSDPDTIQRLQQKKAQLQDSISTRQTQLNRFASIKLNAEKYAMERLINPPTTLPATDKNYDIIYNLERVTAVGTASEIIEGITVHVNSFNDQTNTVSLTIDRNNHVQSLDLKPGASTPLLSFGDDTFQVKLTLKSMENRIFPGKKVARYQIMVQKLKS